MQVLQADRCGPDINAEVLELAEEVEEVVRCQGELRGLQSRRCERQVRASKRLRQ